jgi:hypothetical protein
LTSNNHALLAGHAAEMRRVLVDCDVPGFNRLWRHVAPHLPQPVDSEESLASIHLARTHTHNIPLRLRAYSHRWLLDNGYPSGLPDHLRPKAERIYPRIVEAVGTSCRFSSRILRPVTPVIRGAMKDAVLELYGDSRSPQPLLVRRRVLEAKDKAIKKLVGIISSMDVLKK